MRALISVRIVPTTCCLLCFTRKLQFGLFWTAMRLQCSDHKFQADWSAQFLKAVLFWRLFDASIPPSCDTSEHRCAQRPQICALCPAHPHLLSRSTRIEIRVSWWSDVHLITFSPRECLISFTLIDVWFMCMFSFRIYVCAYCSMMYNCQKCCLLTLIFA